MFRDDEIRLDEIRRALGQGFYQGEAADDIADLLQLISQLEGELQRAESHIAALEAERATPPAVDDEGPCPNRAWHDTSDELK